MLEELKDLLETNFPGKIDRVILFGSRATSKGKEYSDYDILVIIQGDYDWHLEDKILDLCYEIDLKYNIVTDIKVISTNELVSVKGKQPFIQKALKEGISA
ncbi:MAG: nucleotidyltransferase domain-containing protein [candidate division WOR-3 bacterium]|nr:nucleotidyltransferase domain-containing protein [candidate division WOR-3 bacterium]